MAKIRKVTWRNAGGKVSQRFQLTYMDANGNRSRKQFATKAGADAERVRIESEIRDGQHVSDSSSKTVKDGCEAWLLHKENLVRLGKRERVTARHYRTHIERHLEQHAIATMWLNRLTSPDVQKFVEDLENTLSHALAVKVYATLRMSLSYCRLRGWLTHDPCKGVKIERPRRYSANKVKIPAKEDIKALLKAASENDITGKSTAMLRLMVFRGLRISEVRGLPYHALMLEGKTPTVEIFQRADDYSKIGKPKSSSAYRTIPLSQEDVLALKKWLLSCGVKGQGLIFGTKTGRPNSYQNLINRWWTPLMAKTGLVEEDASKFTPHQLRHAFASLHIEHGTQPKQLQTLMGHSSIKITMDTYGHLWNDAEAGHALALAVERQLG
jgi:integrase